MVGHNLIITPALLLDKKISLDEGRFLDFCNLVNSIILHDRIIALPASLPENLRESGLYNYLTSKGILRELYEEEYYSNLFDEQEREDIRRLVPGGIISRDFGDYGTHFLNDFAHRVQYIGYSEYGEHSQDKDLRNRLIDNIIEGKNDDRGLTRGTEASDSHRLRTAVYWVMGGRLRLAYLPDFIRIPIISAYNLRLRQSLRLFIQANIDKRIREEVEEAGRITELKSIPIPNMTLQFLDRYSDSKDLEKTFDDLRDVFRKDREAIIKWESSARSAEKKGYKDTLRIMDEITASLASLERTDTIKAGINIALGGFQDLMSKALGIATTGAVLSEGVTLIGKLYNRAKISYFYTGTNQASAIQGRDKLLQIAFGRSLSPIQTEKFEQLSHSLQKLTEKSVL